MNFQVWASSLVLAAAQFLGVGTGTQLPTGSGPSAEPPLRLSPAELEIYKHAKTLIDWTPRQIHSVPPLHKLRTAENQDELPVILDRVGKTAVAQFRDFPKIDCDEQVYSETSLKNPLAAWGGMRPNSTVRQFRYIVIPKTRGDILGLDEYRTDPKGKPVDITSLHDLKMITFNFTASWLYFSPADRSGSRFRYFGTQSLEKHDCYVVGFAQKPEAARNVSGFRMVDQTAVLLVQGLAWIDEESFHILRIEMWLLAPRPDIGLAGQNTIVNYFAVQPAGFERVLWVPHDVKVTILFHGAMIRNTHRYSKFRLFRVESTIKPTE